MKFLNFSPKTSGEHLFQFIIKDILGRDGLEDVTRLSMLSVGARGEQLAEYFFGMTALNILARCLKKAERVQELENEAAHHPGMVGYILDSLGVARHAGSNAVDLLADASLMAAKDSKLRIKDAVKNIVCNGRKELQCYICGAMVLRRATDPNEQVEFEHLWPASFGGNSISENLLPACKHCNNAKGSMLMWHGGHVNSFVLKPDPSEEELKFITRREKIARHSKIIFDIACAEGVSLKEAALTVGPVSITSIYAQDRNDSIDFFNFEFR